MQKVEQLALETYEKNLTFLAKYHQEILLKIQALNSAIETQQYTPKYDLEYMKDTYFDVKIQETQTYLYNTNSKDFSHTLQKQVDFSKERYAFDGFPMYYNLENAQDLLIDSQKGLMGVYPMMTYYFNNMQEMHTMKEIKKYTFIGIGLGIHIPLIHQKIGATHYHIIEDDLELFNLSLFCTPFYSLETKISFSIAQNDKDFVTTYRAFLDDAWFDNKYLKYTYFPAHNEHKIKLIQNTLASENFIIFQYGLMQTKYLKPLEYINQGYKILNLSKQLSNTIFSQKPTLVLGAGPSLGKNKKWLQENHKKFIIISVGSAVEFLYSLHIKPDLVVNLDGFDESINLFNNYDAKEFLKDSYILFGAYTHTEVRKLFTKEQCYFLEENTFYFEDVSSLHAACVGSTSLVHSLMFDAKEIYLLGLDYAFDNVTGRTHMDMHIDKEIISLESKEKLQTTIASHKNIFQVDGNFANKVYINTAFNNSLQSLHNIIPNLKKSTQKLYNLNDGAKITEAEPLNITDILTHTMPELDKNEIHRGIFSMFVPLTREKLSKEDIISFELRMKTVQKIKTLLLEYETHPKANNPDKYLYDLLGLVSDVLKLHGKRESNNITETYLAFFKYALSIIIDFFNTKELKNSKHHIKKFHQLFVKEMFNIAEKFEVGYGEFFKELKKD